LKPYPREVLEACYKAANELYDETAAANPKFKRVYEPWKKFRDEVQLWFRVAEYNYDSFVLTAAKTVK
jgi:TRAP-type mannitol/chloroaromatic compound transport system substrate-binding protein